MSDQNALLDIVRKWNIQKIPEFRGFRCARCQSYGMSAWHHLLATEAFLVPVHFCESCEAIFRSGKMEPTAAPILNIDPNGIDFPYPSFALQRFAEISERWDPNTPAVLKPFACDECGEDLLDAQGYHVWWNNNGRLIEFHFDPACAQKLGITGL